jgi:tRNA pseudouridine55 synthase
MWSGRVRWALDAKKAGHAGTLDPDATGVLAVALGEATKTVPLLTEALKAYDFTVNWGAETATDDASGAVTGAVRCAPGGGCNHRRPARLHQARSCRCPRPFPP